MCIHEEEHLNPTKKYDKGRQGKNPVVTDHCGPATPPQMDNPNLTYLKKNEENPSIIPTIVNGITNVTSNSKRKQEDSVASNDSINHLINHLSDSVNMINKTNHPRSSKHKIILIGDSHI